jgi:hypothetical protein
MPTMKSRGGDLDPGEYTFNSFSPGQDLKPCGYEKKKDAGKKISFDRMKV